MSLIEFINNLSIEEQVTGSVIFFAFLVQLLYWFVFYLRPVFNKNIKKTYSLPPVSIIICAKNEADNLKRFLPQVLNQDYPNFEVIVVNDTSTDSTESVLFEFKKQHKHLYTTYIRPNDNFRHGKKLAINIGIKAAKHEHLLFTDADCEPASNQWAKHIMGQFGPKTEIVLGYGKYRKTKGLLNKLIRFETLHTAMQYIGFAKAGMPYMGVGRNLAYKKEIFYRNSGFKGHTHVLSGDDDITVNKAANKFNTGYCINPQGFTISETHKTTGQWARAKRRHLSASFFYRLPHKLILFFDPFSKFLFYFSLIAWFLFSKMYISAISILGIHIIIRFIILFANANRFKEKQVLLIWPVFDTFIPAFYLLLSLKNKIKPKNITWK